jgi:hypothetical protein
MKLNKKVVSLINEGLSAKLLKSLNDNQINQLYERVSKKNNLREAVTITQQTGFETNISQGSTESVDVPGGATVTTGPKGTTIKSTKRPVGSEMAETKKKKKNKKIEELDINVTDDPEKSADGMGMFESKNKKKKVNPWAVCTSSVGRKDKEKYEACVQDVKRKNKGNLDLGKNKNLEEELFLENKILNLVQKYVEPKMTKKDFISLIESKKDSDTETKPKETPTKDPGTKTPPKKEPFDPFKPDKKKQPNPKATEKKHKSKTNESSPAPTTKPKETPTKDPGTKTPPKKEPFDPFKPSPEKNPNPKAEKKRIPDWLSFRKLGIKFK